MCSVYCVSITITMLHHHDLLELVTHHTMTVRSLSLVDESQTSPKDLTLAGVRVPNPKKSFLGRSLCAPGGAEVQVPWEKRRKTRRKMEREIGKFRFTIW